MSAGRVPRSATRSATRTSSRGAGGSPIWYRCGRWSLGGPDACAYAPAASRRARSRRSFKHKREGALPPPEWSPGGRPPPPTVVRRELTSSSSSSPSSSPSRVSPPLVGRSTTPSPGRLLLLLRLGRLLLRHGSGHPPPGSALS